MSEVKDYIVREFLKNDIKILLEEGIILDSDKRLKCFDFVLSNGSHGDVSNIIFEIISSEFINYNDSYDGDDKFHIITGHSLNKDNQWVRYIYTTELIEANEVIDIVANMR